MKTMRILVLVPTISNQFYSRIIKGVQSVAEENGYHVMLAITNADPVVEMEYIKTLQTKLVDGIIFLHCTLHAQELTELAVSWPMVLACEIVKDAKVSMVTIGNEKAAYDATCFLLENGNRDISLACAGDLYYSSILRRKGYEQALLDHGIPVDLSLITNEGFSFNAGKRAANEMLSWKKLPDAVFAVSDAAAIGIISEFHKHSIEAGKDISIVGFDNNQIAEYYIPSLTTVSQPQLDIGHKAMTLLIKKMEDISCENEHIILSHEIEIRTSVKLSESNIRKED
ncbi:MAG: substrate-binding domain-containing protein [Oscillospiraceae bacterium]